ncbi:hypothetical protein HDU96_000988, partial [Phlyctochytrium bullatum]
MDAYGTVVHSAAEADDDNVLRLFLEFGADPDARDLLETSALFNAGVKCLHILLNPGADVNARDRHCRTPLMEFCARGNVDVAKILIDHEAHVNYANDFGHSTLHIAVSAFGSGPDVIRLLLDAGAQINAQNREGETPLYMAMKEPYGQRHQRKARVAKAAVLLKAGADPNIKSNDGLTPLGLFPVEVEWNAQWEELLELFIDRGADLQAKTKSGETIWKRLCEAGQKNPGLMEW